jgi:hypothetical protein
MQVQQRVLPPALRLHRPKEKQPNNKFCSTEQAPQQPVTTGGADTAQVRARSGAAKAAHASPCGNFNSALGFT